MYVLQINSIIITIQAHVDAKTISIAFDFEKWFGSDRHSTNTNNNQGIQRQNSLNTTKWYHHSIQSNMNIDSAICYLFCCHLIVSFGDLAARFVFRLLLLGIWPKRKSFEVFFDQNCASVAIRVYCRYTWSMNAFYVCITIWGQMWKIQTKEEEKCKNVSIENFEHGTKKILNTISHHPPIHCDSIWAENHQTHHP